jgi:Fic-DOC domain mobile mystery protein B
MSAHGLFGGAEGKTPLSAEERAGLLPSLATREELNLWERSNILEAYAWAFKPSHLAQQDPLTESYVRRLHQQMFDQTWTWAGRYRTTEKNIGIPHHQIRDSLAALLGDVRYWLEHRTFPTDEIAIRLHHRLVSIHPFTLDGRRAGPAAGAARVLLGLLGHRPCRRLPPRLPRSPARRGQP